jgi:hypothetical protein
MTYEAITPTEIQSLAIPGGPTSDIPSTIAAFWRPNGLVLAQDMPSLIDELP